MLCWISGFLSNGIISLRILQFAFQPPLESSKDKPCILYTSQLTTANAKVKPYHAC